MPRLRVVACVGLAALVATGPAAAHVVATPAFVPTGSSESVTFSGPNELDIPMTAFVLTAPAGVRIAHAHEVDGWDESLDSSTATWLGGPLAPDKEIGFGVTIEATAEPGVVELQAVQRYPEGREVAWSVALTIVPAEESPSQNLALAGVVGLIGVLLVVAIAMLAWRRRSS